MTDKKSVVGFFESPDLLLKAAKAVKDAGYPDFDVFSPFPIHGMDAAQGLKVSPLPFIAFTAGVIGCVAGFSLEYWTSVIDWPLNIGGKPFNSWPAFVPVMFECTILFAGLATVGGMFFLNRLPNIRNKSVDPGLTRDRFGLVIDAPFLKTGSLPVDLENTRETEALLLLKKLGASEVKRVVSEEWF